MHAPASPTPGDPFTPEQQAYLTAFFSRPEIAPLFVGCTREGLITASQDQCPEGSSNQAEPCVHGTPLSELCQQERWKHSENPLDGWDRLLAHAEADKAPDPEHNFRFRWHGLFHVAPAQDSFMLRLRLPAGIVTSRQMRGLASLAEELGEGPLHITTRANLQIRGIRPKATVAVLDRLQDLGLTSRGSGADNLRNITASPDSGLAPEELLDVRPFARGLQNYILNSRDLYDLPRKFNIAFDSGSALSTASDTNDIGFIATRVSPEHLTSVGTSSQELARSGVGFRILLGGITGHRDFARDCGVLIPPRQAVAVAAAMVRVFSRNGDRTDRKKARLKYLLDRWGLERFVLETEKLLAFPLLRVPAEHCLPRPKARKHSWIGVRPQRQAGMNCVGISIPVGKLEPGDLRQLADLAETFGSGECRLTAWQNLLLPDIPDQHLSEAVRQLHAAGFSTEASPATDGIIACTGSRGCKYAGADTKGTAEQLIAFLKGRFPALDLPVNIHITGCPHSCAQHYCGDIGLVASRLPDGSDGYHVLVGGGMDDEQGVARELERSVPAKEIPTRVERFLSVWLQHRTPGETFAGFTRRHTVESLKQLFS